MDLSLLSDSDLAALRANNLPAVSDKGLSLLRGEPPKSTNFGADIGRGLGSLWSSTRTAGESVFGGNEAVEAGLERKQKLGEKYGAGAGWEEVKQAYAEKGLPSAIGEYIRQVPHALAEQAPQIAESAAAARLGALGGAAAGPGGALAGSLAGAFTPSYLQQYGGFLESQAEEQKKQGQPIDVNRLTAAAAAVPAAAIDVATTFIPMGKSIAKALFPGIEKYFLKGSTAAAEAFAKNKLATEGFLKTAAVGTGKGAAVEIPGEVSQQMIDRAQAGKDLFSPEAFAEYGETAFKTSQLGPIGAAGRFSDKGTAQTELRQEAVKAKQAAAVKTTEQAKLDEEATRKSTMDMGPLPGSELSPAEVTRPSRPTQMMAQPDMFGAAEQANIPVPEAAAPEQRKVELTQQIRTLSDTLEEQRAKVAQAATPEESLQHAKRFDQFQQALDTAKQEHDSITVEATPDEKLARAYAQWNKAKEVGDVAAVSKAAQRITELKAAGANPPPAAPMAQTAMPMKKFTGTSESTDLFNQRVVGPEMAEGREQARTQRENTVAEEAALQRMGQAPMGDADAMRQQKLAREQAAALLAAQSAPAGGMPPAQGESQLRALVHRGVGLSTRSMEGRTIEDAQRDLDLARSRRDRAGIESAIEEMRDFREKEARAAETPMGEATAQWAGIQPPDVAAHQDALIARRQGLTQLLMAKPAAREAATGNLRARIVTEIEAARGTQTTKAERQQLAALVDPIIARLLAAKKPTMTDARQAQAELDAIRNKFTVKNVYAPPAEPMGPRESRGTELLREQVAGTPNADLLALAPRKTFAPEAAPESEAPVVAKETPRVTTLKAEQKRIAEQLSAHDALIGESGMTAAEERALSAGDIATTKGYPAGDVAAAIARNATERMDLQGRIDALQGRDKAATTPAEKADIQESMQQAHADMTLLEASQRALLERTRALRRQGTMPEETPGLRTPAELKALHTRKQAIQEQLAAIEVAKTAQEQAAQAARRIATGKEAIAAREAATEKDVAAAKQQAGREELAALPGMSVTHEAAEKAARLIETGPDRIAHLRAKIADPSATKTTRANDKNELKVLLRTLQLAHDVAAGKKGAMDAIEARIVDISDKIAAYQEEIDAGQPRKYRMDTIADLKRERAALRKSEKGTFNPPTKTPIVGTSRTLTLAEQLAAATEKYAAIQANPDAKAGDKKALENRAKQLQKEVTAAADKRATDFLEQALALEQMGTTGKLPKGRISQASRSEITPGDTRTGTPESMGKVQRENALTGATDTITSKTGTRNPVTEERKVAETNRAVGKPEQEVANEIADQLRVATPTVEKTPLEHLEDLISIKQRLLAEKIEAKATAEKRAAEQLRKNEENTHITDEQRKEAADEIRTRPERIEREVLRLESELDRLSTEAEPLRDAAEAAAERAAKAKAEPQASVEDAKAALEGVKVKPKAEKRARGKAKEETASLEDYDAEPDNAFARTEDPFAGEGEASTYAKAHEEAGAIPLSKEASEHIINNDTHAFLNELAKNGSTPEVRALAEKLKGFVGDTSIKLTRNLTDKGKSVAGLYTHRENKVEIHPKGFTEETVLHELVHAATMQVLSRPFNTLKGAQLAAVRQLQALHTSITQSPAFSGEYGKTDLKEFISEVMSNQGFRDKLDAIGKPTSLLKRIWAAVKSALGFGADPASKRASAAIEKIMGVSGTGTAEAAPSIFRTKALDYGDAAGSPLADMADKYTARPTPFLERIKQNFGLSFEQAVVDMRAAHAAAMKMGKDTTVDSGRLTQQAIYDMRKGDQLMPLVQMAVTQGAPVSYTDAKGLHGIKSTGKNSLADVFKAAEALPGNPEGKMALATSYMIAQRVANVGIEKAGWGDMKLDVAELNRVMAYANSNPELKATLDRVRDKYNAYNADLVNFMASTGAIPKSLAQTLLKDGDYVSMYRVDRNGQANLMLGAHSINIGDVRHQRGLEALKGGDTKILPINESMLRNTTLLLGKAMDNQAAKSAAYAYQDLGAGIIKKGQGPADNSVLHFNHEPDAKDPHDDGKRWIKINTEGTVLEGIPAEMIIKSLEGTNLVLPSVLKFAAAASDMLRSGVTRMPTYALRQLIRDPMVSTGTTGIGGNPLSAVLRAGKEFISQTRGTSEAAHRLAEKGLIQSQIFSGDSSDLKKLALQLADGGHPNAIQHLFAAMDRAAMHADAATRVLVHENALKNRLSEVEADFATMESMNFHKRGASATVQYAHRLIPFFSSQIQGLSVLAKAMRGNMPFEEQLQIKQKFYNNAMLLFGTGLAYAAAMQDDDYYKNAKPRDKMSNWFVHLPGVDEPLKIPIPFEFGFFFSAAVAAVEGVKDETDNEQQFAAIRDMLLNAVPGYSNKGMPQFAKPIAEVAFNRDLYSWNPIESIAQKTLDPSERYNKNTSELAKRISEFAPIVSPIAIERIVNGYFGQAPLMIAGAVNEVFADKEKTPSAEGHLTDRPFIGQSFQRKFGGADADAVYTLANTAVEAKRTYDKIEGEGREARLKEYRDAHMSELRQAGTGQEFINRMNALTKQEKAIRLQDMSPFDKQAMIDKLDEARQELAALFHKEFRRVEATAAGT